MDEADRLLEVGFKEELDLIIRNCPTPRTTMLFSATMTGRKNLLICKIRKEGMEWSFEISIGKKIYSTLGKFIVCT